MPGGNDSLRTEKGYTYDGGVEFTVRRKQLNFKGEVTAYDSYIRDWIVWLPTFKGFWSPVNVKKVHSYGIEIKASARIEPAKHWWLTADANYVWTRSINQGDPASWGDESIGKQLVYIPEHASVITTHLGWKQWQLTYKWNYYSERYTTSSNETQTKRGVITPYYMNDIALEKVWKTRWSTFSCKVSVNNLFNEEYESVLSRPMAGRNYNLYIGIIPNLKNRF
ncbi:MAG: TonB-dependent receptor [Tannerellaceae bacterium]|nr:TonB-dependent receptor [Tannerellaceae bacterium]